MTHTLRKVVCSAVLSPHIVLIQHRCSAATLASSPPSPDVNLPVSRSAPLHFTVTLAVAFAAGGCGRSPAGATPPPSSSPASVAPGAATPQGGAPTREDLAAFLRTLLPAEVLLADLQTDAPAPDPAQPGAWVVNAKETLAPKEDLFRSADEAERADLNTLVERYNAVVKWRNGYAATAYGRAGVFADLPVPTPKVRPLLVPTLKAGTALPAFYVKLRAARQVDRWRWEPLEGDFAAAAKAEEGSARRAGYAADALVLGSSEANAFLDTIRKAVADAEAWKASVRRDYANRLREATKAGMTYRGEVSCGNWGRAPVELRFTAGPPASATTEAIVDCEVVVTSAPAYRFAYEGKLYLGAPDDPHAQNNLVLTFLKSDAKEITAPKLPPEALMLRQLRNGGRSQQYFLLLGPAGTITGNIAPGIAGGFELTASPVR